MCGQVAVAASAVGDQVLRRFGRKHAAIVLEAEAVAQLVPDHPQHVAEAGVADGSADGDGGLQAINCVNGPQKVERSVPVVST